MRNKTVIITAIVCAVVFVSALIFVLIGYQAEPKKEIEILLDGKVLYRGSATLSGEPDYIEAKGKNYTNRIRIDETGVKVESATCPNGECVQMGYLKSPYLPIVCLPNNLVIRYVNTADSSEEMDAISQ